MALREEFPKKNTTYIGGHSDGYQYTTVFSGSSLAQSYQMVRQFLIEEGYGDLPLPKDATELERFRLMTRNNQITMFEDNGYVHNPVKILFPLDRRKKSMLTLCIFNESDPDHLLKFHRIDERSKR